MNSHEVIICKIEGKGGVVIRPLLAEGICQAGEPPNLHSHGEVLALDVAGANLVGIRLSDDWHDLRGNYFGRRIPCFLLARRVYFDELREVNARA